MNKDYYQTLGVEKSASNEEIKKAFRTLAHKYHPDKKGGDEMKFKEVNEAYQVLSNNKKRAEYDSYGRVFEGVNTGGFSAGGDFEGFSARGGQGGFGFENLNDIFSEFFAGGMGGATTRVKRGRDISTELHIPFSEAVFGTERKILINKVSQCDTCEGSGAKPGTEMKTCPACNGQGKIHETKRSFLGTFSNIRPCDICAGSGKVPTEKCKTCKGVGVVKKQEEIKIVIPAGINNGEMIRLSGMGEAVANGVPGDLYVKINVPPHPVFKREDANLVMDMNIKLSDALLGAEYNIDTLDGKIKLKVPVGVSHGEILRVRDKGVPISKTKRGDLLIKIHIKFPNKLSKKSKELIEKLKEEGI